MSYPYFENYEESSEYFALNELIQIPLAGSNMKRIGVLLFFLSLLVFAGDMSWVKNVEDLVKDTVKRKVKYKIIHSKKGRNVTKNANLFRKLGAKVRYYGDTGDIRCIIFDGKTVSISTKTFKTPGESEYSIITINNKKIADKYKELYPNDQIIIGDAHEYLLNHYEEFDFIWSSPPCQSHSITNHFLNAQGKKRYPDLKLYEEIILLSTFYKGIWVVENVKPYYKPLIDGQISGRHMFWCNFNITNFKTPIDDIGSMHNKCFTIKGQRASKKSLEERNAVYSPLGLHIWNCAYKQKQVLLTEITR